VHFKGKVAIVTGGSSGIGKEVAKRLAAHGASVIISGRNEPKLYSVASEISTEPGQVRFFAGDIANPATANALATLAEKEFGGLDILINNASVSSLSLLSSLPKKNTIGSSIQSSRASSSWLRLRPKL